MRFTKMHGCGNDYVYVDCFRESIDDRSALAIKVSNRNYGIGSDGLICICPSNIADFKMDMYNSDGTHSAMCGNGMRCLGKYVYDRGLTDKTELSVESGGQIKKLWLNVTDGKVDSVRIDMGPVSFRCVDIPALLPDDEFIAQPLEICGESYAATLVSVGNPHAVIFLDGDEWPDIADIGRRIEKLPIFPKGVNVEFARVIDRKTIEMRVWERGSGETLACGTGATATLAAAVRLGLTDDSAKLILAGGELLIEYDRDSGSMFMTGPATTVFDGELF